MNLRFIYLMTKEHCTTKTT